MKINGDLGAAHDKNDAILAEIANAKAHLAAMSRNQNKQQAGNKSEIVGFHG